MFLGGKAASLVDRFVVQCQHHVSYTIRVSRCITSFRSASAAACRRRIENQLISPDRCSSFRRENDPKVPRNNVRLIQFVLNNFLTITDRYFFCVILAKKILASEPRSIPPMAIGAYRRVTNLIHSPRNGREFASWYPEQIFFQKPLEPRNELRGLPGGAEIICAD